LAGEDDFERPRPTPNAALAAGWRAESAYDDDRASFLDDLACGHEVADARIRGLALRARADADRPYARWLARRLTGKKCPPARSLADDMRQDLEQVAARAKDAAPKLVPVAGTP
jgi:hypothetical protein